MKTTSIDTPLVSVLQDSFVEKENNSKNDKIELASKRKEAFQLFSATGIPSPKNEEWKYTNLASLVKEKFSFEIGKLSKDEVQKHFLAFEAYHVVILNGIFNKEYSQLPTASTEFEIKGLNEMDGATLQNYFARKAYSSNDGMSLLNTAFSENGICIEVKKGKTVSKPVILYFINDCRKENTLVQPRILVIANGNSSLSLIETFVTIGSHTDFTNIITEIVLKQEAHVDYHKIQDGAVNSYHVGTTEILHEAKSTSNSTTITLGGAITRNNLNITLDAEHCEAYLNGLYLINGKQHVDNHTVADHAKPNCYSNELYKGIMDDHSTGVFNGKILVRLDAQKTNAFQSNKNILLSKDASVNTKPQLEIFADDVKCSHGATTGQLDNEALFYLQSRGIGEKEAQRFLLHAFANDVLERIKIEPLKELLLAKIEKRLV